MLASLLVPLAGAAQPVERYGDAVKEPACGALARRIVERVEQAAESIGRRPPSPDAARAAALLGLAARPERKMPPPEAMVAEAMWLHGVVEPRLQVERILVPPHGEPLLLDRIADLVRPSLAAGANRVAACVLPGGGGLPEGRVEVLVALGRSELALDPVPRTLGLGHVASLRGQLGAGWSRPELVIAAPDGTVRRSSLERKARASEREFSGEVRCAAPGRLMVEIDARGELGNAVLARFPIACGEPAAQALARLAEPPPPWRDAGDAEERLVELANRDRAALGLPPLKVDAGLRAVARDHALDMRDHGFVGHTSPVSGGPADRMRRAGLPLPQILHENVGITHAPEALERVLLDTPSSRAALLGGEVDRVGVGVAVRDEGSGRSLIVTELTACATRAPAVARTAVSLRDRMRRARLGDPAPLVEDVDLDDIANRLAARLAYGRLAPTAVATTLATLRAAVSPDVVLEALTGVAGDADDIELPDAAWSRQVDRLGVAVAPARPPDTRIHWVLILGRPAAAARATTATATAEERAR